LGIQFVIWIEAWLGHNPARFFSRMDHIQIDGYHWNWHCRQPPDQLIWLHTEVHTPIMRSTWYGERHWLRGLLP
jgi:hypothetical protein